MMFFASSFVFLSVFGSLFLIAHGGIYTSSHQVSSPSLHSLHESKGKNFALERFRRYVDSMRKRSTLSSSTSDAKLKSVGFSLGNVTTHNQALIHWSGKNSKVILILTRQKSSPPQEIIHHSTLWRSSNYGKNYTQEDDKFDKNSVLRAYYVCPNNKSKIVFVDSNKRVWITTDEGETYTPYNITFSLDKIEYHPDIDDWLLGYDKEQSTLYVSQNLGRTWRKLQEEVSRDRYFWYVQGVDVGANASMIVHMEYRNMDVFPERLYFIKSCFIPYCIPTPFQQACDELGKIDVESLVVKDNFTFAQRSGALEKFYVSYNRSKFVKADFSGSVEQTDFHVVSSDGGTVVVGVNHLEGTTNLFFSDPQGQNFTLSLPDVRYFNRKSSGDVIYNVDIHEVAGIKGTFITNQHTASNQNRSMITWDNGRTWAFLTPPDTALDDKCAECTLNLHCAMTQSTSGYYIPAMLSKKSVPGLLMAHGSVGVTLVDGPAAVNVYTSRDAGRTWTESLKMRHLYVVGDHGAMMVAVKMIFHKPINVLSFSNNFGKNWSTHQFSYSPINVDGLLTEPGEYTHKFTLFGHRSYHDSWKLYALDMAKLVPRNCTYPADFSNWTMTVAGQELNECHLGMKRTFERVEATHCLVGPGFQMKTKTTFCDCTEADYECGFGYTTKTDGKCVKVAPQIDWIDVIVDDHGDVVFPTTPPCINGSKKIAEPVYRRIPGDRCIHDLPEMMKATESCDADTPVTTPAAPPTVQLQLLNKTNEARIGEVLLFSVQSSATVQWSVFKTTEPKVNLTSSELKLRNDDGIVTLIPRRPGWYEVRASRPNDVASDTMLVSFWYPIEDVVLILPPVVEVNRPYNATAVIAIKDGLQGTKQRTGDVYYYWGTSTMMNEKIVMKNFVKLTATTTKRHDVSVMVKNPISWKKTRGSVAVKEYIEILVLPLIASQYINGSQLTHAWLDELRTLIVKKIFSTKKLSDAVISKGYVHGVNFHVFIEPRLPLQVQLIFAPDSYGVPTKEDLLKMATKLETLIHEEQIFIHLPHNLVLLVGEPYVINDLGAFIYANSLSAGSIAAIVIACLVFVVVLLVVLGRKYARNMRWKRYFTMPTVGSTSMRSHIVRTSRRSNDTAPIVDEEEFIDDDLDNMEGLGSTQAGTLQFQG